MRSRYSAFVLGLTDYLMDSWHPEHRPARIEPNPPGLQWLGLQVKAHVSQDADHATVEFAARSKLAGRAHRLHELSRFQRLDLFGSLLLRLLRSRSSNLILHRLNLLLRLLIRLEIFRHIQSSYLCRTRG